MSVLIRVPLDRGGSIIVEADEEVQPSETLPAGRVGDAVADAQRTFEAALESVVDLAETMLGKSREASGPDEINVEFGLKVSAEAGAIIAKAGGEANFKLTLGWKSAEA